MRWRRKRGGKVGGCEERDGVGLGGLGKEERVGRRKDEQDFTGFIESDLVGWVQVVGAERWGAEGG